MSAPKRKYAGGAGARYWLLGSALALTMIGLVMIYSASSVIALAREGNSWLFLQRQAVFALTGWILAIGVSRVDYRMLKERSIAVWGVCLGLLIVVLVIGVETNGAARWIPLGLFSIQPSELAKVACVVVVAGMAADWQRRKLSDKVFGTRTLVITGLPAALIIIQPDMGTTATLVVSVALVLLLAGMKVRWFASAAAFMTLVGVLFVTRSEYRMARVTGFLNPWADPGDKGYQSIQALYAFGSGGLEGVGLGLSRQKFFYLPEAHTDFILAIVGEEAGLIGTLAIVVAFCIFVWAGFRIAAGARDGFGRLLAGGLTGMLAFQAVINMAAVTGMMPVTGKPLPFVSYGGASLLVTMLAVGLVLSVSEYGMLVPRAVRVRPSGKESAIEGPRDKRRNGRAHLSSTDSRGTSRRRA